MLVYIDPDNPTVYLHRGIASMEPGNYEAAIADYNMILQLEPALSLQALELKARTHYLLGNYAKALADYSSVLSTWREIGSRADEGRILLKSV
jgi:tetratricopeptide (TPR) repeat protein